MAKIVWGTLLAASISLAIFIAYLTLTNPEIPTRGFVIALAILFLGGYPYKKLKGSGPQQAEDEPPGA